MEDLKKAKHKGMLAVLMLISLAMSVEASEVTTNSAQQLQSSQRHSIPFERGSTLRYKNANQALNAVVLVAQGASIHIIGRPDSAEPEGEIVSQKRAMNIRNFLVRNGVSPENITLETSSTPSEQANGNTFPSDVFVSRNTAPTQATKPPTSPITPNVDQEIAKPNGQVYPVVEFVAALQNPPQVANIKRPSSPPSTGVDPVPETKTIKPTAPVAVPAPVPMVVPVPVSAPVQTPEPKWTLFEGLTLQQNLDAWAKDAGWNKVIWNSANTHRIKMGLSIKGSLTDALEKIAVSTGLNICTAPAEKYIRISDSAEYCAKSK